MDLASFTDWPSATMRMMRWCDDHSATDGQVYIEVAKFLGPCVA